LQFAVKLKIYLALDYKMLYKKQTGKPFANLLLIDISQTSY